MAVLNDDECTKFLKTHYTLYNEWKRLEKEFETAQQAVRAYQPNRDELELNYDPKQKRHLAVAQREMDKRIKNRDTVYTQKSDAHKKFGDFHRQIEKDHGKDFLNQLIEKARSGKTTWN